MKCLHVLFQFQLQLEKQVETKVKVRWRAGGNETSLWKQNKDDESSYIRAYNFQRVMQSTTPLNHNLFYCKTQLLEKSFDQCGQWNHVFHMFFIAVILMLFDKFIHCFILNTGYWIQPFNIQRLLHSDILEKKLLCEDKYTLDKWAFMYINHFD